MNGTPLVAGNWKMHKTLAQARELVMGIRAEMGGAGAVDVLICPPFPWLVPLASMLEGSRILLGAQNVHEESFGAFTGEVSAPMLADAGCSHVIIGHSERRQCFGEAEDRLKAKVRASIEAGLTAIYCVGETLEQREAGRTFEIVSHQLAKVLDAAMPSDHLVLAYEPVWAIGTGKNATPQQAQEVHACIREHLERLYGSSGARSLRILYGGSVKPGNAASLFQCADVNGALVGGASLIAEEFLAIIRAA